jgi:hypothetical protein
MVWTFGSGEGSGRIAVTVEKDGRTSDEQYDANMSVREALAQIARKYGIASMNVETDDGEQVTPSDAERNLGEFGHLTVTPKVVGA